MGQMGDDDQLSELNSWVHWTRKLVGYRAEAADFLQRARSQLPTHDSDLELLCELWSVADQHDVTICTALTSFDEALRQAPTEIDVTRGVELDAHHEGEMPLIYRCTWALDWPDSSWVSVVLSGRQLSGAIELEVRDSSGATRQVDIPVRNPADLYEAMGRAFFRTAPGG